MVSYDPQHCLAQVLRSYCEVVELASPLDSCLLAVCEQESKVKVVELSLVH